MRRDKAPLLIEIGCEEIPARMIARAASDLGRRLVGILDEAGLEHDASCVWGGPRRLSVRVDEVQGTQADREEQVVGPSRKVAFGPDGSPTRAAEGFARKQGIGVDALEVIERNGDEYVGFQRRVEGRPVGQVLADRLPGAVGTMSFPKTMRWGDGSPRWVRPVHWVVALHGKQVLELDLFGIRSGSRTRGHRFRSPDGDVIEHPDDYESRLASVSVMLDSTKRRERIEGLLHERATSFSGRVVEDPELLSEASFLVEWPAIVGGEFDRSYLELPREILVTTLRHHQKCFSIQDDNGELRAAFLAVADGGEDPAGHIRRGNEWVVGGRLEDARFFWREDRRVTLESRFDELERVVFHTRSGSFGDKARRMVAIVENLGPRLELTAADIASAGRAARAAKIDLVTGTVGEFPELQGQVGGLLLSTEGAPREVAGAVYSHYLPTGPDDPLPADTLACVVSLADKLDNVAALVSAGESPTGSRDPLGLRRASSGIFRILIEKRWPLSLRDLIDASDAAAEPVRGFLLERFQNFLRDRGFTPNEIAAVFRPRVGPDDVFGWALHDVVARLDSLRPVRERDDFAHLVDLTKRVDNILAKNDETFRRAESDLGEDRAFDELAEAARALASKTDTEDARVGELEQSGAYSELVDTLAGFVDPVDRFFLDVLVIDPDHPRAMLHRRDLLVRLRTVLTHCFDLRELAGQADRR